MTVMANPSTFPLGLSGLIRIYLSREMVEEAEACFGLLNTVTRTVTAKETLACFISFYARFDFV